jgi:two-component system chemotaxis response regulator CheY
MALDLAMPILVVDDYQTMVRIIRNLLKQLGFEDVDDASDGTTALAKLKTEELRPRDLGLEHGAHDGLRAPAPRARRRGLRTTPFIMVTAESKTRTSSRPRRRA